MTSPFFGMPSVTSTCSFKQAPHMFAPYILGNPIETAKGKRERAKFKEPANGMIAITGKETNKHTQEHQY